MDGVLNTKGKKNRGKSSYNSQIHNTPHWAITSTYLPFFFPRAVPPLRTCGAPSKSSIELALLRDVEGLGGGAKPPELPGGVDAAAPVETDRGSGGTPSVDGGAGLPEIGGGAPADDEGRLPALDAIGGVAAGGTLVPLVVLLGPIRGGGGGAAAGVALLGSFLLTHFFKSLS